MSEIHIEILDKEKREVFTLLRVFKNDGYLAGGTALALQIKHRKSYDFDVFVGKSIGNRFKLKVRKIFGDVKTKIDTGDELSFTTRDGTGVTFLWYYFPTLYPLIETEFLSLASFLDIAADKAHTIGRRAVWRDYVDIFVLLKKHFVSLKEIVNLGKRKFGGDFNETLFLEQLVYFKDVEASPIEFVGEKHKQSEIMFYLERAVKEDIKRKL